jgi:hypothetical protein
MGSDRKFMLGVIALGIIAVVLEIWLILSI